MYKLAEQVGILILIMAVSQGSPAQSNRRQPWEMPCGTPMTGSPPKDIPETVLRLNDIVSKLERTTNDSGNLKHIFVSRLQNPYWSIICMNKSTILEGFPSINSTWPQIRENPFDVQSHMVSDHVALSTVYIYLEQTIKDEIDHDNDVSVVQQLRELEESLLSIMCYFERNINQTISYPSRSVMPNSQRNLENRVKMYFRDVMLLQGTHLLLNAMFTKYDVIMKMHRILDAQQTVLDASIVTSFVCVRDAGVFF